MGGNRDDVGPGRAGTALQLPHEEQVRELALEVGTRRRKPAFAVEVVEVDASRPAPLLLTHTTRAADSSRRGRESPASAKCPRWFTPKCISNPCAVRSSGVAMPPALLTRTSSLPWLDRNDSPAPLTDSRSARSISRSRLFRAHLRRRCGPRPRPPSHGFDSRARLWAPFRTRAPAVSNPVPLSGGLSPRWPRVAPPSGFDPLNRPRQGQRRSAVRIAGGRGTRLPPRSTLLCPGPVVVTPNAAHDLDAGTEACSRHRLVSPLPPSWTERSPFVTVSPGLGRRGTRTTRSTFTAPGTKSRPPSHLSFAPLEGVSLNATGSSRSTA